MYDAEQQKEYDEAMAKLEAGEPITSAPEEVAEPVAVEPPAEAEPAAEPEKVEATEQEEQTDPDPLDELRTKLEKAEKALKDTQAWGTKNAQRLAEIERERERQQREASRPEILDANPELADAIRYVAGDPSAQDEALQRQEMWRKAVEAVHPGIFQISDDDELVSAIAARRQEIGQEWENPLVAIREITAQKLAHTERQFAKKFEAETKARAQKAAMSVPGSGGGNAHKAPADPDKAEVDRIQSMSAADFEKERRKALGY